MQSRDVYAMQFALAEIFIKHNPQLRNELQQAIEFYRETFFHAGANTYIATDQAITALNHRIKEHDSRS